MNLPSAGVTQLLKAWIHGDQDALGELAPKVYIELRRTANNYIRNERTGQTLQATALVHEVFLRLVEVDGVSWRDRAHFFAVSTNMMRRILVDRARARDTGKRGGGRALHFNLDDAPQVADDSKSPGILAVDEALDALAQIDARKAKVVELRFFGGFSVEESAEVLAVSSQTIMRDWKMARAWLLAELARRA